MELQHPFRALTPTVDGDVLCVLASSYSTYTVTTLARLIEARSPAGIRQSLARLTTHGLVREHGIGRARAYSLNDDHLLADAVRDIADARGQLIERLRSRTMIWYQPPSLGVLFGSAARGEMSADSDIDILLLRPVEVDNTGWLHNVSELSTQASGWTGNDVRIVDVSPEDLSDPEHDPLLRSILADGIVFQGDLETLRRAIRAA